MHNIDDFKSEVGKSGGFAINNLFRVFLPPLKGDSRSLDVLCKFCISARQTNPISRTRNGIGK